MADGPAYLARPFALRAPLIRRIFSAVILRRIALASPTCAAAESCCVWCTKNDVALMRDRPYLVPSRPPPFFARAARREIYFRKCGEMPPNVSTIAGMTTAFLFLSASQ